MTQEEKRQEVVNEALPYIVGTDVGDGRKTTAEVALMIGFDKGVEWAKQQLREKLKDVNEFCSENLEIGTILVNITENQN